MFLHFNLFFNKDCTMKRFIQILCATLFILSGTRVAAQPFPVTITISVSPPYTARIDDYINQPNKVMATLLNTSAGHPVSVYLQGSICGDNGVKVYTDPSYKPSQPVLLQPGIPYRINLNNLGQIFNADHLIYEGVTKKQLTYGNGIPEGDYTICLRAFDYSTGQALSAEDPSGCSNHFLISDIEPPVLLQPVCEDEVVARVPQSIVFTWTRPPGAPVRTQYNLKIVEILPSDRNMNDAVRSAVHPVFMEKTVNVSSYLLTPADPALVVGKRYAILVTAFDPSKLMIFRNNGMSEVCSFKYVPYNNLIPGDTLNRPTKK
jgi:TANFOR domain-containing protein